MIEDSIGECLRLLDVGEMSCIGDNRKLGRGNPSGDLLGLVDWRRLVFSARDHER